MTLFYLHVSILALQKVFLEMIIALLPDTIRWDVFASYWYVDGVLGIIIEMLVIKIASVVTWFFEHVFVVDIVHFLYEKIF